jgi:hypothetical protein
MAAMDFPASPTIGQTYIQAAGAPTYTWDGTAWVGQPAPKTWVSLAASPPTNPADGDLWWQSDTGVLFLRYNDGSSTQWVVATPAMDLAALDTRYVQGQGNAGCFKVSSGSLAASALNVDIPLPAGYHTLELLLSGYQHTTDAQQALLRMSLDGTTFKIGATDYQTAGNISGMNAVNVAFGSLGSPHIIFTGNMFLNAAVGAAARILLPTPTLASHVQTILWDWVYQNTSSTSLARVAGSGWLGSTVGRAQAVRLLPGSGSIAAGLSWQLNGYR